MINISTVIKDKFESGDDVRAFTHKLVFKDMDTQTITNVDTNIKPITEDIKIDGIPIGKFPIANIEFSLTGDWTKTYKVGGNYEVYVVDEYKDGEIEQVLTGKSFIITEIEYDRGNRETSFKGYDYGSKLSEPFDNSSYTLPMTLGQFATKFFNSYGLQITNVNDMFMKDYQLKVIPSYDTDVMGIQVARDIAKLSLSTIFIGQDNKVKIVDTTRLIDKNLARNDFSDFTNFQGSLLEIDKTFPINYFKGGKNILLDTNKTITTSEYRLGTWFFDIPPNQGQKVTIIVEGSIGEGREYIGLYNSGGSLMQPSSSRITKNDFINGIAIKTFDWQVGTTSNTFLNMYQIPNTSTSESTIKKIKMIIGEFDGNNYSPNPRDGYNYSGLDCSYHIKTRGGSNVNKMLRDLGNRVGGFKASVISFSFNENLIVRMNGVNEVSRVKKGIVTYSEFYDTRETGFRNLNFTSTAVDKDLDFIASDPKFFKDTSTGSIEHFKSFEAHSDNFRSLGVNTLTLGLQADIDGENVSKSDSAMIGVDEVVELRIDDIPFVFSQDLKREVIDLMFSKIKGFKYHAFESVSKNFYYEIGDCFKQVGNGINGESYDLIAAQQTFVRNGSMITTHSIESQSKQETEMKWENFTDQRKTEILVNKATQEIKLINSSITVLGDKYTELNVKVDGIDMKVSSIGNDNIIFGFNGDNDMIGWGFLGESSLKFGDRLRFYQEMKWNSAFVPSEENSASGYKITWVNNNQAITNRGRVVGGDKYSYRGKRVNNTVPYQIYVREYLAGHTGEDENLIKNDFSDFTAYQGSIVTRKKTFPIDVFKGARNLWTIDESYWERGSITSVEGVNQGSLARLRTKDYIAVKDTVLSVINADVKFQYIIFSYRQDRSYISTTGFQRGDKTYNLSVETKFIRLLLAYDTTTKITLDELGLFRPKLYIGNESNEPYSPAPEDGYNYQGYDGAWHIESSEGTSRLKLTNDVNSGVSIGSNMNFSIVIHNFNTGFRMGMERSGIDYEEIKRNSTIFVNRNGVTVGNPQMQFVTYEIIDTLDFIASNPSIYTGFTESLLLDTVSPKAIETASITLKPDTRSVRLRIVGKTGLSLTDQMFNRGEPREWELSAEDVKVWAESQILIRDNTIALQAQEIDNLNNDIHNAGIEINAVNGITTWGSSLNVMNSDKSKSLLSVVTKDGEEYLQIDLSNSSLGNFTMDNGAMVLTTPPYERMYEESDLSVIKNILETSKTPTPYQMHLYDINKDGKISVIDLALVKSHLMNVAPITVFPIIQSRIIIGNNTGEFLAQALYNNGNVGSETKIRDNRIETGNLSVDGISFGGKSVEVDTNGFLKVV